MTRQEALALLKNEIDELFYNRWHKAPAMREALTVLESALNLPRVAAQSCNVIDHEDGCYEFSCLCNTKDEAERIRKALTGEV